MQAARAGARAHAKFCRICRLLQAYEVFATRKRKRWVTPKCEVCKAEHVPLHGRDKRCGRCSKPPRGMVPGTCRTCKATGMIWSRDVEACIVCLKRPSTWQDFATALRRKLRARPAAESRTTKVAVARAWLRDALTNDPRPARELYAEAAAAGITRRTLERAAVGVVSRTGGARYGPRSWSLPLAEPDKKPPPKPKVDHGPAFDALHRELLADGRVVTGGDIKQAAESRGLPRGRGDLKQSRDRLGVQLHHDEPYPGVPGQRIAHYYLPTPAAVEETHA